MPDNIETDEDFAQEPLKDLLIKSSQRLMEEKTFKIDLTINHQEWRKEFETEYVLQNVDMI